MLKNQKGFTLIEIIAVLVILGILAAVAVPKYVDMQTQAKKSAAMGQVAELKGTLNSAWGKAFLVTSAVPSLTAVLSNSGLSASGTLGSAPDSWGYTLVAISGNTGYTVGVTSRDGDTDYVASGNWMMPP